MINLEHRPGRFIVRGHRFGTVWPPEAALAVRQALGGAHIIGPHRTLTQDVSFGIDQLVEIAARVHRDAQGYIRLIVAEPAYDRLVQRSMESMLTTSERKT